MALELLDPVFVGQVAMLDLPKLQFITWGHNPVVRQGRYLEVARLVGVGRSLVVNEDVVRGVNLDPGAVHAGAGSNLPLSLDAVVPLHIKL